MQGTPCQGFNQSCRLDPRRREIGSDEILVAVLPLPIPVYLLLCCAGGKTLLSGAVIPCQQVEVFRWDVASGKKIPLEPINVTICDGLASALDQRLLALAFAGGPVKLWDFTSGRLEATLRPNTT